MQVVKLPYAGEKYSLLILLPDEGKGFGMAQGGAKRPDVGHVKNMLDQMRSELVELYLPRFTVTQRRDIAGPLVKMGVRDAFTLQADFRGMKSTPPGIFLAWAREQVVFAVDEEGTEAASAVTVGGLFGESKPEPPKPIVMRVDRPCIMVLVEEHSGMPLFVVGLNAPPEWRGK
jgi:serpin B